MKSREEIGHFLSDCCPSIQTVVSGVNSEQKPEVPFSFFSSPVTSPSSVSSPSSFSLHLCLREPRHLRQNEEEEGMGKEEEEDPMLFGSSIPTLPMVKTHAHDSVARRKRQR